MPPKTVYITGASSGIGHALALECARRGAEVTVSARRLPELERLVQTITERGGKAHAIQVDVADAEAAREAVAEAARRMGKLDMVIANAGIGNPGHITTMQWAEIERVLAVNVKGALSTLFAAMPIMLRQGGGHLVGVSSLAGRRGLPNSGAYSASKAAVTAFLDTLRLDLGASNIAVSDVQPGFVETPILDGKNNPTPFKWKTDRAARYIVRRLESEPATVAFPWPLDFATAVARVLPAWLYDWALTRASRRP